jgi:carboxyl-terminal processing protease
MRRWPLTLRAFAVAALVCVAPPSFAEPSPAGEDALAALQAAYASAVPPGEQADFYRELFAAVLHRVQRSYATEVDLGALAAAARKAMEGLAPGTTEPREVFAKAINTALRELDPYSRYLSPRNHGQEREGASGSFGGVGLQVEPGEGAVRVIAPMPGTPAARAGLQPGDLIVRVDEQPLAGVPLPDAIAMMRGAPGTPVSVTVRRSGRGEEFTVSLTRETIRSQAVQWSMEGDVLVLRLNAFSRSATGSLQRAIEEASSAHTVTAVVLDMRGNPGGLLTEAVRVADMFLTQGEIVSVRGRTPERSRSWQADEAEVLAGLPMLVLIDGRSASASELVAAALQDNGRATLMGQRSFGKGTVQTTYTLGDESRGALKLTSSFYHRPSGASVQQVGVMPDVELVTAAGPGQDNPHAMPAAAATTAAARARVEQGRCASLHKAGDPVLSCAVGYLRAGSVQRFVGQLADVRP